MGRLRGVHTVTPPTITCHSNHAPSPKPRPLLSPAQSALPRLLPRSRVPYFTSFFPSPVLSLSPAHSASLHLQTKAPPTWSRPRPFCTATSPPQSPAPSKVTCHTNHTPFPKPRSVGITTPPINGHVYHKPRPPNPRLFPKPRPPTVGDESPHPQAPPIPYRPALFPITCHTKPRPTKPRPFPKPRHLPRLETNPLVPQPRPFHIAPPSLRSRVTRAPPHQAPPIPEAPPPPTVGDKSPRPPAPPIPYRPALFPITCHTSPAPSRKLRPHT